VARIQKPGEEDEVVSKERIFAAVGIRISKPGEDAIPEEADEKIQRHLPELPA
jgi:hypothetical protein